MKKCLTTKEIMDYVDRCSIKAVTHYHGTSYGEFDGEYHLLDIQLDDKNDLCDYYVNMKVCVNSDEISMTLEIPNNYDAEETVDEFSTYRVAGVTHQAWPLKEQAARLKAFLIHLEDSLGIPIDVVFHDKVAEAISGYTI